MSEDPKIPLPRKAHCPRCQRPLPLFFSFTSKHIEKTDQTRILHCPLCKGVIKAEISFAYRSIIKKAYSIWYVWIPVIASAIVIRMLPDGLTNLWSFIIFFLFVGIYVLTFLLLAHHLMKFKPYDA